MRQKLSPQPTTLVSLWHKLLNLPHNVQQDLERRKRAWPRAQASIRMHWDLQRNRPWVYPPIILPSCGLRSNTDCPARLGHGSESRRKRKKRKEVHPPCSLSPLCNQAAPGISPFMRGSSSASLPCFLHLGEKLILIFNCFLWMKARQGAIFLPHFQKMS